MQSDDHLLALVGEGDERALGHLYARYASVVFAFVLARVSDRGVAEEVSADVWLGCWRSARAFRRDAKVLTWLLGIAKRQIYMHTRRKRLPQVPLDDEQANEVPSDDLGPAELVLAADQAAAVMDALDALPEGLSEVVRLAWLHELPYEEIADVVGVPVGTVKSRVSRARWVMSDEMRRLDVGVRFGSRDGRGCT